MAIGGGDAIAAGGRGVELGAGIVFVGIVAVGIDVNLNEPGIDVVNPYPFPGIAPWPPYVSFVAIEVIEAFRGIEVDDQILVEGGPVPRGGRDENGVRRGGRGLDLDGAIV